MSSIPSTAGSSRERNAVFVKRPARPRRSNYEQKDQEILLEVGAVIMATGFDLYNISALAEYGWGKNRHVLTAMQFERMICASGPTQDTSRGLQMERSPRAWPYSVCRIQGREAQEILLCRLLHARDQRSDPCS